MRGWGAGTVLQVVLVEGGWEGRLTIASAFAKIGRNSNGAMLGSTHSCWPVNAAHPPSRVISAMGEALGGRKPLSASRRATTFVPFLLQASSANRIISFVLF